MIHFSEKTGIPVGTYRYFSTFALKQLRFFCLQLGQNQIKPLYNLFSRLKKLAVNTSAVTKYNTRTLFQSHNQKVRKHQTQ